VGSTPIAVTIEYARVTQNDRIHHLADQVGFDIVPLLTRPLPTDADAESYAADLVRKLDGDDRSVGLVIAVCLAAPIGHEVARLLSQRGVVPTFVPMDGAPVKASDVIAAYQSAASGYGGQTRQAGVMVTESRLQEQPTDLLAAIRDELAESATAELRKASSRVDLVAPMAGEIVNVSIDWIGHLVAAHNAAFTAWDGEVVLATSDQTGFLGPWPGARCTRRVAVGGTSADLARNPLVCALLADEMASWSRLRDNQRL
jgi:hypothetical protein